MKSDHYFSENPQSNFVKKTVQTTLFDHSFTFMMSTGVFSKKGIDFGTKLLIEQFELPDLKGDILDLGCGYGPIGIALGYRYKERSIMMVDINERAVSLAKENASKNNIQNVTVKKSDGYSNVTDKKFAAIVSNPPIRAGKDVIYPLFKESASHLVNKGELWLVIQKKQGAPSACTYLASIYDEVEVITRKKGYYIIRAKKNNKV